MFKDNNQFWKIWNSNMGNDTSKNQTRLVGGLVDPHDISELFAKYFSEVCQPNSVTVNARLKTARFSKQNIELSGQSS